MKVLLQILKEFLLPLVIALGWTLFNLYDKTKTDWSFKESVNIFGPTFFFISWLISQWFRVKKQQKVETGLSDIEASIKRTLSKLDAKTIDLVGHITGGDSACYIDGNTENDSFIKLNAAIHIGHHTLYDVNARIVNVLLFTKLGNVISYADIAKTETNIRLGNLIPGHANMIALNIPLGRDHNKYELNIFFSARNGSFTQLLRFRKVENKWLCATRVERESAGDVVTIFEKIDENYPLSTDGEVEWQNVEATLQLKPS